MYLLEHERLAEAIISVGPTNIWAGIYMARMSSTPNAPPSPREAALQLAAVSKVAAIERQNRFERRFRELSMSKNNAAAILAGEFGISEETARKKLQGVDVRVSTHGAKR